jgi:hypothetical protein
MLRLRAPNSAEGVNSGLLQTFLEGRSEKRDLVRRSSLPWPDKTDIAGPTDYARKVPYTDITEHAGDVNVINLGIFMITSNYQYVDERQ